ncbi:MAG: serine/threonine-protein kinase, partial [Polyangiales bacterium]
MSPPPTQPKRPSSRKIRAFSAGKPFGDYVLDERIAIGGTAEVYLARPAAGDTPAPRLVIKRLLSTLLEDPLARTMFAEEAALHQRFAHPNIVTCYGAGAVDDEPYLAMELVQGADLHRVLRLAQARRRPIAPPLATHLAREILAALEAVHSAKSDDGQVLGIIHRDVTPSNIYLSTTGDVKLGDFGIAHPSAGKSRAAPGTAIRGKFAYLAPEQVSSDPVDTRADLFAIANVLAESLLGRPLFPGSGQLAVLLAIRDARIDALNEGHQIPPPLVAILRRALARNPNDRYPDAKAFSTALSPFSWQDRAMARREVAQLVRWSRETSLELRALGKHPSENRPIATMSPPDPGPAADSSPPTPQRAVPRKSDLKLDPALLDSLEVRDVTPKPSSGELAITAPFSPPPSRVRTVDGRALGPFPYAKLMEMIATGRLEEDD